MKVTVQKQTNKHIKTTCCAMFLHVQISFMQDGKQVSVFAVNFVNYVMTQRVHHRSPTGCNFKMSMWGGTCPRPLSVGPCNSSRPSSSAPQVIHSTSNTKNFVLLKPLSHTEHQARSIHVWYQVIKSNCSTPVV